MKTYSKNIVIAILSAFLLNACIDEDVIKTNGSTVEEGIPVTASLTVQAIDSRQVTKATPEEERVVKDLFIIIFDKAGNYKEHKFFNTEDLTSTIIQFETTSGEKRIYGAANLKGNSFTKVTDDQTSLIDEINAFLAKDDSQKGLNEWMALSATMTQKQVTWGTGTFLMTGCYVADTEDNGTGTCIINEDGRPTIPGTLKLIKTVASVTFNISSAPEVTFVPTSWQVRNVPLSVDLYREEGNSSSQEYFDSEETSISNNTFSFYMLENRQSVKIEQEFEEELEKIQQENITAEEKAYKTADLREKYNKAQGEPKKEKDKQYLYAPTYGSYIILKGTFQGTADNPFTNKPGNASAEVTYFIHLGYIDGIAKDFSILRNHKYTYNIKVVNVDKIIVEAYEENEDSYRADGDVVFTDAEIIEVDAHYARIELSFKNTESLGEFMCEVSTAKSGFENVDVTAAGADIDWIQFIDTQSKIENPERPNFKRFYSSQGKRESGWEDKETNEIGLMSINDLSEKYTQGKFSYDNSGNIKFYAYIKENYYNDLELDKFINYSATTGKAKSRSMTIALQKSNKGNSSVSSSRYIIRQKPIITIFNMDDSRIKSGLSWGFEWVSENEPWNYSNLSLEKKAQQGIEYGKDYKYVDGPKNSDDGLSNMKEEIKDGRNYINWDNSDIQNKAYAACMSRNRDENGDGVITDDEIKWYLPAINQYQYMWIGMNAIPEEATLYPKEFRDAKSWQLYHYYSNTNKNIFWAEEGAAVSPKSGDAAGTKKHIRCARNIGTGNKVSIALPTEEKIQTQKGYKKVKKISIDYRLTSSSLRTEYYGTDQLLMHNEYSEQNKLFKYFYVYTDEIYAVNKQGESVSESQRWTTLATGLGIDKDNPGKGVNICKQKLGSGWRAPNQRELILLTTIGGLRGASLFSATYFSMYYDPANPQFEPQTSPHTEWKGKRIGYRFQGGVVQLVRPGSVEEGGDEDTYKLKIRCVKDAAY